MVMEINNMVMKSSYVPESQSLGHESEQEKAEQKENRLIRGFLFACTRKIENECLSRSAQTQYKNTGAFLRFRASIKSMKIQCSAAAEYSKK